jgi:hypothetical protein
VPRLALKSCSQWHNTALVQPAEARREVRSSSAKRGKRNWLASLIDLGLMDIGIEVEHVHQTRPLTFENGANFRLEETQLARVDRP